jgi:hypothetical protein
MGLEIGKEKACAQPPTKICRRLIIVLWLCVFSFLLPGFGQTNHPAPAYPENRYLLVVETSRPMQRHAADMTQSVQKLLASSLAGQARSGDTVGVWTYNENIYSGLLALQRWTPQAQKSVTDRVVGFLSAQKFEKRARPDKVIQALDRVVRNSTFITIILVCLSDEEIHGTPFDDRINEFLRSWHVRTQDAGAPFVIALRAQGGKYVDCSMNPSPWPAELPPLPQELLIPIPAPRALVVAPPKPATSAVPPLIISGKKHAVPVMKDAEGPKTTDLAPTTKPEPAGPVESQLSPIPRGPAPVQTGIVTEPGSTPAVASLPTLSAPVAAPSVATSQVSQVAGTPPAATTPTRPEADSSVNTQPGVPSQVTPSVSKPDTAPAIPAPLATSPSSSTLGVQSATEARSDSNITSIQVATTGSTRAGTYSALLWGTSLALLATSIAIICVWRRSRSRSRKDVSLITQSIERRKN